MKDRHGRPKLTLWDMNEKTRAAKKQVDEEEVLNRLNLAMMARFKDLP